MSARSAALGFGVGLLSGAVLMFELLLTRLFSVTVFYHFAFMAVAVAMLGLGLGGLVVYLNRHRLRTERLPDTLAALGTALAVVLAATVVFLLNLNVPDTISPRTASRIGLLFAVAAVPFLFAGALFSLLVWRFASVVHRIYSFDLTGAALGSLAVLPVLGWVGAPNAALVAAVLAAGSGLLLAWATGATRRRLAVVAATMVGLIFLLLGNLQTNLLDIRYAKGRSTSDEVYARWNAISRVCVHPAERGYRIRIDCDAATDVPRVDFWHGRPGQHAAEFSRVSEDLAHVLRPGARTLVIGAGGGNDVARAIAHGSTHVVAVEINPLIAEDLMLGLLREDSRRLFERPEVKLVVDDARSAIQRTPERFDVMQSTLIDTWASTAAGAFALTESYLYTVEAFEQYLGHLAPEGILTITRWEFTPPHQALRVVSLGRAAMEHLGVAAPARHFLVVQDGSDKRHKTSVLMKRSPFTPAELQQARAFLAANRDVLPIYLPDQPEPNEFAALLAAPDWRAYTAGYPFDISPTHDARPFFFFTTRSNRLLSVFRSTKEELKNNVALFILAVLVLITGTGVLALLLLPLWFSPRPVAPPFLPAQNSPAAARPDAPPESGEWPRDGWAPEIGRTAVPGVARWTYFLCLGLAYIIIEIALIQTFILFMGHPTYGLTVVVFSLLVGSGLGSRWSARLHSPDRATLAFPLLLAALGVAVNLFLLPQVLPLAQSAPRLARGLLSVALVAPLGFLMGVPFPTGVRSAATRHGDVLPWLWSANAGGSVFGSVLAIILAIQVGIPWTGALGALLYVAAAAAAFRARAE